MKPAPFEYVDPDDVTAVLDVLAERVAGGDDVVLLAGGQSLVPLMNLRLAQPDVVIDLRRCGELRSVRVDDAGVTAGALVTAAELLEHTEASALPGLAEALGHVGHPQIRNRTTIGGSIAHADPAAELPALLVALDGHVVVARRARAERRVSADEWFLGPTSTAREPDELLVAVHLPRLDGRVAVMEVGDRPGDFAVVGVVVAVGVGDDHRIVVFGAGGRPQRLRGAEAVLREVLDEHQRRSAPLDAVIAAVRRDTEASGDVHAPAEYRRHVAGTLVGRALAHVLHLGTAAA
ncbi:MAG: FAD binding domain-containing protein [Acidimicrobiales bacterium]|nr:FAD binding domain-containing protein [Acidimicrobiales bacterium]